MDLDFEYLWINIPFEIRIILLILFGAILTGTIFVKDDNGKFFSHYIRCPYLSDDEETITVRRSKRLAVKQKVNYK